MWSPSVRQYAQQRLGEHRWPRSQADSPEWADVPWWAYSASLTRKQIEFV